MPFIEKPRIQSFLIADQVQEDPRTGTYNLFGVRTIVFCPSFPFVPPPLSFFIIFTDCRGEGTITFTLLGPNDEELCKNASFHPVASDPLAEYVHPCGMQNIFFPTPGVYRVQIDADGEVVAERKLRVLLKA